MSKYQVNSMKPTSPMKKYEHLREVGVLVRDDNGEETLLKGKALDDHIDRAMWQKKHPGQEPIREFVNGLPAE